MMRSATIFSFQRIFELIVAEFGSDLALLADKHILLNVIGSEIV
jgi:hypothetical protein